GRFDVRVDDGLPPVTADESRTLQVLQNLLDNACKFSPEGSPIEVDVSARDEFVHVRVRDHGEGLEPDQTTQVFRKFVRAARGNQGGLGLGLAIARNLVEAQGGRIWAESEGPGKGSVFTFTLPLWREPEEDQRWRTAQNGATVLALD